MRPELGQGHRRHAIAAAADHQVDGVDRILDPAAPQQPAGAFGDQEVDQQRCDEQRDAARQPDQTKAVRVIGEQEADERQQGEGAGEHDLVDRGVGAAVLRRHQLGGDGERRRDREAEPDAGDQAQHQQLREILCPQDQQCAQRGDDDADLHHGHPADAIRHGRGREAAEDDDEGGPDGEGADLVGIEVQRLPRQHEERAAECQVVALDEADEPEHHDQNDMIRAERDAIELASQQMAGGYSRPHHGR